MARETAGYSQKQVALELDWSFSKVSRIESGVVAISPSDVRALFSLLGAESEVIQQYVSLAFDARRARSWQEYRDVISDEYANFIGMEQSSSRALKYEAGLVPGLFQIVDYAMAVFDEFGVGRSTAARLSEVRQLRQGILDEPDGPEMTVIMGEFSLACRVGGRDVMRRQIDHLIELSSHPRISLLLMPFTAGAHPGLGTPFTILRFREEEMQSALYFEDGLRQVTSAEDESLVAQWTETFQQLTEKAESSGSFSDHAQRIVQNYYGT